jgi:hypothetical protein
VSWEDSRGVLCSHEHRGQPLPACSIRVPLLLDLVKQAVLTAGVTLDSRSLGKEAQIRRLLTRCLRRAVAVVQIVASCPIPLTVCGVISGLRDSSVLHALVWAMAVPQRRIAVLDSAQIPSSVQWPPVEIVYHIYPARHRVGQMDFSLHGLLHVVLGRI